MIQMRTWLTVADNSGARKLTCIMPVGGDAGLQAGLGDVITAAGKEATPESQVKKSSVVKAVVVRVGKKRGGKGGAPTPVYSKAPRLNKQSRGPRWAGGFRPPARG